MQSMPNLVTLVQLIEWSGGGGRYKLAWRVETSSPWVGPLAIELYFANTYGIRKGVAYSMSGDGITESDPAAFASAPVITPLTANRTNWTYSIEYSDSEPPQTEANPLLQPAEYSRFAQSREEAFERDVHGRPIRNSASDRYDEVLTRDTHRTVMRVVKNYPAWPQDNYAFMNTVNRTAIRVSGKLYKPKTIRVIDMRDTQKYSSTLQSQGNPAGAYNEVQLEFAFAEDDWEITLLDQGLRQSFRRWRVSHTVNASTTAEKWSVIRAESRKAAEAIADLQFAFGWSWMQEIAPGFEPCRAEPPQAAPVEKYDSGGRRIGFEPNSATGAETKLPMLLNGLGKQQHANGTPVWLKYQGYFEAEFAVFGL
jgi:hypothetical protein